MIQKISPGKVSSNMEAAFKQELQKQAYPSFSLILPFTSTGYVLQRKMTHHYH